MELKANDRVVVVGPKGSAQLGKNGSVVTVGEVTVEVLFDGEQRPRNFKPSDLKKAGE